MSRSGYSEDCEMWDLIRWRGAVRAALNGKRGQAFLRELAEAMDAMPEKRLVAHALQNEAGEVCALGVVGQARGIDLEEFETDDAEGIADAFGLARAMVREIEYENDEGTYRTETPGERWSRMRAWVDARIVQVVS